MCLRCQTSLRPRAGWFTLGFIPRCLLALLSITVVPPVVAQPTAPGEVGLFTLEQPGGSQGISVPFLQTYQAPIVVVGPPSFLDPEPAVVRVEGVTPGGFRVSLEEWEYQDGVHGEEAVGFLVVEAGTYTLPDGTAVAAGAVAVDHTWAQVTFPSGVNFTVPPVVFVQQATANGSHTATVRLTEISSQGFRLGLQEEEAQGNHVEETVHWIALTPGVGEAFEVGLVSGLMDHTPKAVTFGGAFSTLPAVLGAIQTFNGQDTAFLRHRGLEATGVELLIQEETSKDGETDHPGAEVVAFGAFEPGLLGAVDGGSPLQISGFTLIDSTTDQPLGPLANGDQIDLSSLEGNSLNIVAEVDPAAPIESVAFVLQGPSNNVDRNENLPAYALFGNSGDNYSGRNLAPGQYALTATPYPRDNRQGEAGIPLTV
ncbi:MAG: hypothetical protein ACFCBW_21580, partial [Candidatus Competibacterales bacterium]